MCIRDSRYTDRQRQRVRERRGERCKATVVKTMGFLLEVATDNVLENNEQVYSDRQSNLFQSALLLLFNI